MVFNDDIAADAQGAYTPLLEIMFRCNIAANITNSTLGDPTKTIYHNNVFGDICTDAVAYTRS